MARAKSKTPILQLDAAQTQDAVLAIKRFMEDRFELELGSFEAEELLDFFAREFARTSTTRPSSTCSRT